MNSFRKRTISLIGVVSILLASVAGPASWFVARERAERTIVDLSIEESHRLIHHNHAINLFGPDAGERAAEAASTIAGGLFDIAEVYDSRGNRLAVAMTGEGREIALALPEHARPNYTTSSYQSLRLPQDRWVLRVFVPLRDTPTANAGPVLGYFEGVRIIPAWQREQIFFSSLSFALMACFASLLCGAALYPVVMHLSADNEIKAREVLDSHLAMIGALGRAIAKRDSDTGAHNYRVAWIAACIAERMGLEGSPMQSLITGAFLHDVGKIGIPDAILLKPDKLSDAESDIMRTHVTQGEEIVASTGWLEGAQAVVAGHHEKWDGSGYPRKLQGEEIPLSARIFAVADVFDALCSKRPYKEPMDFGAVMSILERDTGSHFDPAVMAVFRTMAPNIFERLRNSTESDARQLLEERVQRHFGL